MFLSRFYLHCLLFVCITHWQQSKCGFINEPCSSRNTLYIENDLTPINEGTQCLDLSGINKTLTRNKKFLEKYTLKAVKNIKTIYGEDIQLPAIPKVEKFISLEEYHLSNNNIRFIRPKAFRRNTKLHLLILSKNKIRTRQKKSILMSNSLKILILSFNNIVHIDQNTFKNVPHLTTLLMDKNKITKLPQNAFASLKYLRYLRLSGYSAAALLAIVFAIPFALRVLIHKESGRWNNFPQAFYHAHLELFLGNGCLGVGVMMLLALTVERYVSVCHPAYTRPLMGPPHVTVALIPVATFLLYLPSVFRGEITHCLLGPSGPLIYQKRDNTKFLHSLFYSVYKVIVEVVFKVAPTILLAGFNLRIMIVYRRTCDRRRKMTLSRKASNDEDPRKYAEERRLVLLLGSTSILFLVCVSPMVILNVTLSDDNLTLYPYQVFRALANLLEITNYSITFYIYCLFSEDFRNTLLRTMHCAWGPNGRTYQTRSHAMVKLPAATTVTATGTPPTMNSVFGHNNACRSSV